MRTPGILITAASSGSGKTVISCGLMEALKQRGLQVVSGKCGPDYIDPMFHREVLGIQAQNLDLFFYGEEELVRLFERHGQQADIAVVEGVMGYYDGMGIDTEKASSYAVAEALDIPAVLVLSCRGSALSAAALVKGFLEFREESHIRGIILNRISAMLYPRMKKMLEEELEKCGHDIKVLGYVPENEVFCLESRHLGLVTPSEITGLKEQLKKAGEILAETLDLEELINLAKMRKTKPDLYENVEKGVFFPRKKKNVRIAVAKDEAFCFYYKDNQDILEELGCELVPFSPLHDRSLPENVSGLLLGGGYPELYADRLSENESMREAIRQAVRSKMPCHAECGGFLYLHEELADKEGTYYPMAGVIKGKAHPKGKLVRFGYVCLETEKTTGFLHRGEQIRGHEFHYWDSTDNGTDARAVKPDGKRSWQCVHMSESLFAGFTHLSYGSEKKFAERFVEAAKRYAMKKEG